MPHVWADTAQLALDTLWQRPTRGIPTWMLFVMEHRHIERIAGVAEGSYRRAPEATYLAMQRAAGVCALDQFIPLNPLTMGDAGFAGKERGATTGAAHTLCDGLVMDGPEAVVEHLERFAIPALRHQIDAFAPEVRAREILAGEEALQATLGPGILKTGYGFVQFPTFLYTKYGYGPFFSAYALYPEVMEQLFSLQADLAVLNNRAAAQAYQLGGLPPLYRLDHDMADSRGTLVRIASLERLWFPHFARAIQPLLAAGVRLLWHCDGNLMAMVPRLLEAGLAGFQGFQYEDGMDYQGISRMRTRAGEELLLFAGVSVTRTLPFGSPDEVRRELRWLVECGPRRGLFLGASSSITPGVPWANMAALLDGLAYYCEHGRA
jgi:hypothetical protein